MGSVISNLTAEQNSYRGAITEYLQCNLHGDNSTCTIKRGSLPIGIAFYGVVATLMDMAIPWVLFLYIVKKENLKKMKEVCCFKKIMKNEYFTTIKKLCCSKKAVAQNV